ncbi:MAG TPA: hypothetical protein O0W79_04965 [Methanocorpusculum sp.]|nr:hypothetical protein [Methanocorpusculum sp.]
MQRTAGYSGAELAEVVKNAALSAFLRGADSVIESDLLNANPQVQPLARTCVGEMSIEEVSYV